MVLVAGSAGLLHSAAMISAAQSLENADPVVQSRPGWLCFKPPAPNEFTSPSGELLGHETEQAFMSRGTAVDCFGLVGNAIDGSSKWNTDTDLELHFTPVLVKLLLQLVGLPEVALQLAPHDDEPEADEHDDAAQHYGVDQPGQHCVHKPRQQQDTPC